MKRDFSGYRSTFQCQCIVHTAIVRQFFPDWKWPDEEPKFGDERRGKFGEREKTRDDIGTSDTKDAQGFGPLRERDKI